MSTELRKRVVTGILGAVGILSLLIFGNWVIVFFLVTLLSLGLVSEFATISLLLPDRQEKKYVLLLCAWVLAALNLFFSQNESFLLMICFLGLFTYFLLTARRHVGPDMGKHFQELTLAFFGLVYLVFLPFYFRKIYESSNGVEWSIVFLLIHWAGDSGAYFAGRRFGKTKLYLEISPKKTREGAWGGLALGWFAVFVFKVGIFHGLSWGALVFVPGVVGVTGQIGDLCESFFKRAFQVKDSSSILPGHGGLLDRFDGVVFSLPVMYACIRIFT